MKISISSIKSTSASGNSLKLPNVIEFEDYHEDMTLRDYLKSLGLIVTTEELGNVENGGYAFLVYAGKRPTDAVVEKLLAKKKIVIEPEE